MHIVDLLNDLNRRGVSLHVESGKLRSRSESADLAPDIVAAIRAHKDALIAFLSGDEGLKSTQTTTVPHVAGRVEAPLSYGQQRLWLTDQLEGATPQYNIPTALHVEGRLDEAAVQRALDALLERHEVLRTVYAQRDGEAVQVIAPATPVSIAVIDLSALDATARDARVRELAATEAMAPFDLSRDCMLRVTRLVLGADEQVVLFTMHHIASDGWSSGILVREFVALYAAFANGRDNPLAPLAIQYADYAQWQRDTLQGDALERQLGYWRERLAGLPAVHDLPLDRARTARQSYVAGLVNAVIDGELTQSLRALAQQHEATLFMLLHGAFAALLSRWSGESDIAIGVPSAGRNLPEVEPLIGFFINTLVMRSSLEANPTTTELLAQSRQTALEAYAHQDVPFESLIDALQPQRDLAYNPLCQVKFVVQNYESRPLELPGLRIRGVESDVARIRFDLDLTVNEAVDTLRLNFSYKQALFDAATIERMANAYVALLRGMVAAPQVPVLQLALLDADERSQVLAQGQGTTSSRGREHVLPVAIARAAQRNSDAIAVRDARGRVLTHQQLDAQSNRLAQYLVEQGIGAGQRVGIVTERSVELPVALLAVLKSGAAYVPLDPRQGKARLAEIAADAQLAWVLASSNRSGEVTLSGVDLVTLDGVADANDWLDGYFADAPAVAIDPASAAYVIYTSGSTGKPKGVEIRHSGLMDYCAFAHGNYYVDDLNGSLVVTSAAFDLTVPSLYVPLLAGGTVELMPDDGELEALADRLANGNDNALMRMTPGHVQAVLALLPDAPLANRHVFVIGGEAFTPSLATQLQQRFPHATIWNHYGPTETVVGCALHRFDVEADRDLATLPIGRAMENTRLYVLDAQGQLVPNGVAGELHIGGAGVAIGYLHREELTAQKFIADPFFAGERVYRSGDRVRWRDGELEFLGRVDDQVKLRGYRIELGEIEARLRQRDDVADAVVVVRGADDAQRLVAYVVSKDTQHDAWTETLRTALAADLPDYMVPSAFVALSTLPRTPNGKIDRKNLPEPDAGSADDVVAPATTSEHVVAEVWAELLRREVVSVTANFFALGGNSLLATRVVSAIAARLHKRVEVRAVFEHATVRRLAAHVDGLAAHAHRAIPQASRDGDLALSYAQQRLWFIDQLDGATPQYNMPVALRAHGALNVVALQQALDVLLERHEVLRTGYAQRDGVALQRIAPAAPLPLRRIDLRDRPAADQEAQVAHLVAAEAATPFDLSGERMLRASLLALADDEHVILLTMHHIASDGWSIGVLIDEVTRVYAAIVDGRAPDLAPLPVQYADYAQWQRERLQGAALERQLGYWREHLAGVPDVHGLPLDRPRPAQQRNAGRRVHRELDVTRQAALTQLAQREQVTLFMLLHGAFATLLGRWSGEDDIVIGTPVAGRLHRDLENLVGFFVNTLVLRSDLSGNPSFQTLLAQSRQRALGAFANQEIPFEMLVDALQPARSLAHTPLFQVMFSLRNHANERRELALPGVTLTGIAREQQTVKFDLELIVTESPNGLLLEWLYADSLFDATTIARLADAFERLLDAIVANPSQQLREIDIVAPADRAKLAAWNDTAADFAQPASLVEWLEAQAARTPDAIAVVDDATRWTYAQLHAQANHVATRLVERGVGLDDVVAVCVGRSAAMIAALLSVLKAGAAYVPLDPAYPPERLAYMLDDSRAVGVLADAAGLDVLPPAAGFRLLVESDATEDAGVPANREQPGPNHLAYVIYTSGSTGQPKGVMLEHGGALNLAYNQQRLFGANADSRVVQFASLSFDAATWDWLMALGCGAALYICSGETRQSPALLGRWLCDRRITHATLPPALLPHMDEGLPYALDALIVAGEACDPATAWRWAARVPLFNAYGPTEATVCASVVRVRPGQPVTIGRPLANVALHVLGVDGQEQPIGVAGELVIGGAGVARGYLGRTEQTANAFAAHRAGSDARLYRSGDRARWLANGELEFLGRDDDQVKLRGFRIELGEIEWQIRRCDAVREAAVLLRGDGAARRLVAYVVPRAAGEGEACIDIVRDALRRQLPEHLQPAAWVALDVLPLTANGKLDRKALPDPEAPSHADARGGAARDETERALCEIWAKLLRIEHVGIHDNFFAIGGDSILSTQVVARANQAGIRISTRLMFENQTVAQLARAAGAAPAILAPQHAIQGDCVLLPIQRRFLAQAQGSVDHYNQSLLLVTPPLFDASRLAQVARALYERHDALRLRFDARDGEWQARHEALSATLVEETVAIERLPDDPAEDAAFLAERGQHWQRSLDIGAARLWRIVHFDGGSRAGRLLVVVHHLVVDGVSWRVLLADLERALRQSAVALPPKTSSLQQWAQALDAYAGSATLREERSYWLAQYAHDIAPLEPDRRAAQAPRVGSTERIAIALDAEETDALLHRCATPYRTRINELLLAGVYLGMRRWRGVDGLRVALEGHGREPLFDELDCGETVGWFTSLYPLALVAHGGDTGEVIKAVKEQCRAVPAHGVGYGVLRHVANDAELARAEAAHWPQLVFNYLGQFDQTINTESLLQAASEAAGDKVDPAHTRPFLLGVGGKVAGGQLRLTLDYSPETFDADTMARLAAAIGDGLRAVIAHCLADGAGAYTPSDFPLARIDQTRLDAWQCSHPGIARIYPATPMQQGMLYHGRLDRTAYVTQTYPVLAGELDAVPFRQAWQNAVARHDIFRTAFLGEDSELHQLVLARAELPWHEEDWRELDAATQAERFAAYRRADKERGFDFAAAPLMRIALFRLGERRWQLLWTHHHMLLDGWCLPLVYREVMAGYAALAAGDVRPLPPAPLYENYMAWLARQPIEAARGYWRERLGAIESPTPLSIDRIGAGTAHGWREAGMRLSVDETERVQAWAREQRTTVNTVLQLAWAYLLHRYSGESRVVFGAVTAGRPAEVAGIEDMVGLFINALPVVVDFDGTDGVASQLYQLQQDFQHSQDHGWLALGEIQRLSGVPAGVDLFDSLLVFENYPVDAALEASTRSATIELESNTNDSGSNYRLTLVASATAQLRVKCAYRGEEFADATIERLFAHLRNVVLALAGGEVAAIADIELADGDEHAQLLAWGEPHGRCLDDALVHRQFEAQAQRTPDAIAAIAGDERLTYAELNRRANRLAHALRARGAKPEVLVGLALERSLDMVVAMLATLKSGAAYVPLDPNYPPSRLAYMLADSGIEIAVVHNASDDPVAAKTIALDDAALYAQAETDPPAWAQQNADSLAYVMYTSGSTGQPKGVMIAHRGIARLVTEPNYLTLDADTVFLQLSSTSFDAATLEIWGALLNGGRVVMYPPGPADVAVLNRELLAHGVTTLFMTIGMFEQWTHDLPQGSALREVMTGGDVVSPAVMQRACDGLPQTRVISCYGPTENTTFTSCHPIPRDRPIGRSVPLGRPINGTRWRVLTREKQLAPIGGIGELYLAGAGLARGYWRRDELTAQRFVRDVKHSDETWYRSGDLVRWRADGQLDFIGRADAQIKLRGFRIELGEIEFQLRRQDTVKDVAVVIRGEGGDKRVVAYVVPSHPGDSAALPDLLRTSLAQQLPEYMLPSAFVLLDALPLTVNGKLDRQALPEPDAGADAYVAPRTPTEAALVAIWETALGHGPVGVETNFFELGGHSITAMKVVSAVGAQLGCAIGIRDLFTYQSIAELARFVEAIAPTERPTSTPRQAEELDEMEW
jgi:amino acid adenylation domain-containing protein/non-ribosomal peptide synthase protein (TIGR01720 family)